MIRTASSGEFEKSPMIIIAIRMIININTTVALIIAPVSLYSKYSPIFFQGILPHKRQQPSLEIEDVVI